MNPVELISYRAKRAIHRNNILLNENNLDLKGNYTSFELTMELQFDYMAKKKKAARVGRPSRKDLGKKPLYYAAAAIEQEEAEAIRAKFGTIAAALRFTARPDVKPN
jgi:hypothetical protein